MKILLFCHLGQIREYAEYIKGFKKVRSVETVFLTMGQEEFELGQQVATFDVVKDILPNTLELNAVGTQLSEATQRLRELELRLGSNFVNQDIFTDRFFSAQPRLDIEPNKLPLIWSSARVRLFMALISKRLEQEIADFGPDFIFVETSFAPTRMAWRLARERGIPAGGFMSVRFWPERVYLEAGIGYDWAKARIAYNDMVDRPMVGEELARVESQLKTIVEEKTKPAYLKTEHAKGAPDIFKRLHPARLIVGLSPWIGKRARTSNTNPQVLPGSVFSPLAKIVRYREGQKAKRYLLQNQTPFEQIRTKKYAVYFLHVQPEITVEGMAFDYQDQVNTLRTILACLPADMELVVKEHTPMLGFRPLAMYKSLVSMPGLIVAQTHEDSHTLITHAVTVITLTGTVALEAILYGVPAIVLGSIYFDGFNGVYKPGSLNALRELLLHPDELSGATRDDALRALGSLYRASNPGKPARVDITAGSVDPASAENMMLELEALNDGKNR
ncbi:MAG: hypothetical protein ACJA2O_003783 [Candidatus Azotimanducaceae bacterium]|jgi:hypothetical protein